MRIAASEMADDLQASVAACRSQLEMLETMIASDPTNAEYLGLKQQLYASSNLVVLFDHYYVLATATQAYTTVTTVTAKSASGWYAPWWSGGQGIPTPISASIYHCDYR